MNENFDLSGQIIHHQMIVCYLEMINFQDFQQTTLLLEIDRDNQQFNEVILSSVNLIGLIL